ncbi:MAG: alkaline phosphatase [bacterium]
MDRKNKLICVCPSLQVFIFAIILTCTLHGAWARGFCHCKNIIILIPDGCSQSIQTASRWLKKSALALDTMNSGTVETHMANSVITDSAAAASAFSTGYKTTGGFISTGPRPQDILTTLDPPPERVYYRPLATILEGAKLKGKATGLVVTSSITDATPAAFATHILDRYCDNDIMEHIVYQNIDVVLGGGRAFLMPPQSGGLRTDGEDLLNVLLSRGYQFVETRDDMDSVTSGTLWGLFADFHMEANIDRTESAPYQPSLSEMTAKAIELLSKDPDGFFLMVEGSNIDRAAHNNDPFYMITEFLAFDEAVKVACDFAKKDKNTCVIAFPDHNTGGFTIGNDTTGGDYTYVNVEEVVGPFEHMRITAHGLANKIGSDHSPTNIITNVKQWWGIDITLKDVNEILSLEPGVGFSCALAKVITQNYTVMGWSTHGHTGDDVPIWSFGPKKLIGHFDNTQIAETVARWVGFRLDHINAYLFVDVREVFDEWLIDTTDTGNPVLTIEGARLPIGKDIMIHNGIEYDLGSIVVHSPKYSWTLGDGTIIDKTWESVFIPLKAVWCLRYNFCK